MNPFNEIKEVKPKANQEVVNRTQGFENTKKDVNEPRHIKTNNEHLEGKNHPETGVPFRKHVFRLDGEKVEGVFPVFQSKFDTLLPKDLRNASDNEQFKYCTEKLKQRIERDPGFAKEFTPRQLEQIKSGSPVISGLTWHHNEIPGKMQLVNTEEHAKTGHTGGRSIWGGGQDCRR